jgi:hypothetical protein
MPTVTIKLSAAEHARLAAEAERRRTSKSAVLREAFAQRTSAPGSLLERARHLVGALDGPGDLSIRSRQMKGYGRFRRP